MCGICAVFSDSWSPQETKIFESLLLVSVTRGEHSTGLLRVDTNGKYTTYKTLDESPVMLYSDDTADEIIRENKKAVGLIGHCRHATKGQVTLDNAHPFDTKNVVGVHNGTILQSFSNSDKYGTDSEALYNLISERGLESALSEVAYPSSAYALLYYDKKQKRIVHTRNSQRPLWISFFFGGRSMIMASEIWMIDFVKRRCKLNLNTNGLLKDTTIEAAQIKEGFEFSFDPSDPKDYELKPLDIKPKVLSQTYAGHTYHDKHGSYGGSYSVNHGYRRDTNTQQSAIITQQSAIIHAQNTSNTTTSVVSGEGQGKIKFFPGFKGRQLPKAEWERILDSGCCYCRMPIESEDGKDVLWYDEEDPVCTNCQTRPELQGLFGLNK